MKVWHKIVKYLILWAVLLICLVVYTIVKHREFLGSLIMENASAAVSGLAVIAITIGAIIYLFRILIR